MNNQKEIQQNQFFISDIDNIYIDYEKNKRYFSETGYILPLILFLIGIVMILFIKKNLTLGICGWIPIICSIVIITIKLKYKVTDEEYDLSIKSCLFNIKGRALEKLNINEDEIKAIPPISFDNFDIENATKQKKGKDGLIRSNLYKSIMLFFTKTEIHCYELAFETTKYNITKKTDIYFYNDIVSVSCMSNYIKTEDVFSVIETIKITTKGGNNFSISFNNTEQAQNTINTMRSLLRLNKLKI